MDRQRQGSAAHSGIALLQCEACGTPTPMQYDYVDRHGDIEQLCAACYTQALEGNESPELASRDRRVAWILAAIGAALLLCLAGCGGLPKITAKSIDGIPYIEVLDATDNPCGNRSWRDGCYSERAGLVFVYLSEISPAHVRRHEVKGHVKGMRHTQWAFNRWHKSNCATVTVSNADYPLGSLICVTERGESIYPSDTFAKE